jgi:hypothetical protein
MNQLEIVTFQGDHGVWVDDVTGSGEAMYHFRGISITRQENDVPIQLGKFMQFTKITYFSAKAPREGR